MRFKHLNSAVVYNSVNLPPEISGIQSAYTLTQGQDTVITAAATDPEGDAITWSFEEVTSGSYTFVQQPFWTNSGGSNIGRVVVYETSDLNTPVAYLGNPYAGDGDVDGMNVSVYNGKIYVSAHGVAVGGTDNIGAVGVYDAETFEFLHNITPPDAPGNAYHYFSADRAPIVHEGKIYISARGRRNNMGGVYVFDETTYDHVLFIEGDEYSTGNFGAIIKIHNGILYISQSNANISGTRTGRILGYNISSFVFNNDPFANANKLEDRDADFEITASTTQTNQYFGRTFDINDNYLVSGSGWYDEGGALSTGTIWVFDVNDSYNELTRFTPSDAIQNSLYGFHTLLTNDDLLFVSQVGLNAGKFIKYDLSGGVSGLTTSAETVEMGAGNYGYYMSVVGDRLYVGGQASADDKVYVYNTDDLSLVHTFDLESNPYGSAGTASIGPSALNGVTVTQSDNVFTVTPAQQDANFQLSFKATDSEGNVTFTTSDFTLDYVNQAPSVAGIDAAYTLTQGQDTVITAAATDPEGDAITWSFEETTSGSYALADYAHDASNGTQNVGRVYLYDADGSNERIIESPVQFTNYKFAESVFVTEDKVVVGAPEDTENGFRSGAVWVYDHDGSNQVKVTASDGAQADSFGRYLSAGDGKIVVGAPDADHGGMFNTGAAYIYDIDGNNEVKIIPSDTHAGQEFGSRVAIHGNKVYITALKDNEKGNETGAVYIYNLDGSFDKKLLPQVSSGNNLEFGEGLAVSNNHILVSARGYSLTPNVSREGLVEVFDIDGNHLFRMDNPTPTSSDYFGYSIAINSDKFVIGSFEANGGTGSVYIYDTDGTNEIKVNPAGIASGVQFGRMVSIVGNRVIAASYSGIFSFALDGSDIQEITPESTSDYTNITLSSFNSASQLNGVTVAQSDNVFTVTPGQQDATFTLAFKATDSEGNVTSTTSDFTLDYVNQAPSVAGIDAAYTLTQGQNTVITAAATDPEGDAITWSYEEVISGTNYVVVSAVGDDSNSGSIYVYDANDLSAQPTKITSFDRAAVDLFGMSIATTSDKIFVGASGDDDNGSFSGSVYVYDLNDLSAQPMKLTAHDGSTNDKFGSNVVATSDKIFITATADNGTDSGFVYVYDSNDLSAQPTKLTPFDGAANDYFGYSVAVASNSIFIGAPYDDDNGFSSGSVYVYDANDLSAQPTKLTAYDGSSGNLFGARMYTFGDKVVITSSHENNGIGSVYVYDANDLSATPTKLTAFDGDQADYFGNSVVATSDKIVVGAYYDDDEGNNSGSVYVFDTNDLSAQPTKLTAFDGAENDGFGISVATINDKIFVGAFADDDNGSNSGSVYVYDANDLSTQPTKLTAFDGAANDQFGGRFSISPTPSSQLNGVAVTQSDNVFTVTPAQQDATFTLAFKATDTAGNVTAVSSDFTLDYVNQAPSVTGIDAAYTLTQGQDTVITASATDPEGDAITWSFEEVKSGSNYVIVNAFRDDDNGLDSGSVYVYDANDLSAQPTKLTAFDGASSDSFGFSVAATADKIIVGATGDDDNGATSGSVYVFDINDLSAQPTKLTAFDGAAMDQFGYSVAATADKIVVGAMWDQDNGSMSGSVYVYDANDLSASPTKLTAFDGAVEDWFGQSVAATDDKIIVGAYFDDDRGSMSGSVYVYDANDLSAQPTKLTAFDGAQYDQFGSSIATTSDKIFVGARGDDENVTNSGSVYVFDANDLSAQPTKLTAFDGAESDSFGYSVAAADKIVVGAPYDDDNGSNSGSVYVYDANDLSAQPTKLTAFDGAENDNFGYSVAATADKIVVGAYADDDNGSDSGSVYVYDANDLSAQPTKLTAFDGAADDFFGYSVAAISASSALNGVTVTQSDNVFTVTPGTADANFQLRITATDSEGNATSVTSDFTLDYVNQAPSVTGIESSYTLTQGQDTVITASATDPEGDAITWSYEEALEDNRPSLPQSVYGIGQISTGSIHFNMNFNTGSESLVQQLVNQISSKSNVTKITFLSGDIIMHEITRNAQYIGASANGSLLQLNVGSGFNTNQNWSGFPTTYAISEYGINQGQDSSTHYTDAIVSFDTVKVYGTGATSIVTYTDNLTGTDVRIGDEPQSQLNGVTVTQSDNVFTVTPAQQDATFTLAFKATDTAGNVTAVSSDFTLDYVNQAPSVAGIDAAYTLTQGQDTVITAAAVDPEGDAITWSFEEVASGSSGLLVWDISNPYFYDPATMTSPSGLNGALGRNGNHMDETYIYTGNGNHDGVGAIALHPLSDVSASPTILKAPSPTSGETFGMTTSSNDDYIFVGAMTGAKVYVFNKSDLSHHTTLSATDSSSRFGISLSVNDTYLFVGADADDDAGQNAGAVYVYDLATFTEQTKLSNPRGDTYFGSIIKSTNSKLLINLRNSGTGRVFVYDTSDFSTTPVELEPVAPYTSDSDFGMDIAVSTKHDKLFVSHRNVDDEVSGNAYGGAVYVYDLNNLSVTPEILIEDSTQYFGEEMAVVGDTIWIASLTGDSNSAIYGYDITDLDATPTIVQASGGQWFGLTMSSTFPASALNGVTITQSDNVFTVTPAQQDATFQLTFKATDSEGNVTSVSSDFTLDYVNQAPAVSGIESSYLLSAGGDAEVITAAATDPEGDTVTWSFEEVISGSGYVVVSAPYDDDNGTDTGSVYVYDANDLSAQPTKLTAFDGAASDRFGYSIATSADKVVVGAYGDDDNGTDSGSVYVYDANDLSAQPTKLTAFDGAASDVFGFSVAVTADKIVVGATEDDDNGSGSGSVYVFDANDLSASPTKLTAFDGAENDYFGISVAATADNIIVSARGDDDNGTNSGSVYVYDANDLSAQPTKLTAYDGEQYDYFGGYNSVATTADKIIVGAYYDDDNGTDTGSVYVYDANDLSAQPTKLTAYDGTSGDNFSRNSVAATADKIIVGAYYDDDNGTDTGSVYVYDANDLSAQPTKLTAYDGAEYDYFGYSVAANADKIFVGASGDDDNGSSSGSVYVYDANDLSAQPTKLTAFDGAVNDSFGRSVSAISASSALNGTTVTQSDNVFTVTPGSEETSFSMRFTATDANGNATTTTSLFTVQESVMPSHPALTGRTIVVGAYNDNELRDNGTVSNSSPGAIYIYKDNTMTKVMPSSINDSGSRIKFGGAHTSYAVSAITSSKIYTGSEQFAYSYDLDGSNEFHFNMIDTSLYSSSVRSKFAGWENYFGSRAISANDSYVAISAIGANNGSGSIAIFDPQGNFLYDIDGSQSNDNNFGDKMIMLPNNRLVVGQRTRDYGGSNRGAMYLYSLGASSASLVKSVYGSTNSQQLGSNLETNGSLVVAGLHFSNGPTTGNPYEGYVSVYDSNLNHQFNIEAPAEVSASYLNFGKVTAIGSDKIAVSSSDYSINKVWFYDLSGNPIGEIEGPSNSGFAGAGSSRSIKIFGSGSSQLILITATGGDEEGANMGDVWIYDQNLNLIGRLSGYDSQGTGTTIDII